MKKIIIAAFSIAALSASSAYAGDTCTGCFKDEARTVDEAFNLGIKIAQDAQLKLGDGEENAHLYIIPEKDNGLYSVQVCPAGCTPDEAGT